jgi:3-oxoacyl-[acyl-carrier protein] reductase
MMKRRHGVVLNITSVVGLIGNAGQANYAASKAGLIGLTKSVAKELAGRGVRCNAIAPGFIRTDMTDELSEAQVESLKELIPMGALGEVEDVAGLARFLAGPGARYITGQVLAVDGGMVM